MLVQLRLEVLERSDLVLVIGVRDVHVEHARFANVDLAAMPDRLANEAAPSSLRAVITVRGVPGVASADGPAVIVWTEQGIAYRLASPTRTTTSRSRRTSSRGSASAWISTMGHC